MRGGGEGGAAGDAGLCVSHAFCVCFARVNICPFHFPLLSGVGCGL